MGGRGQIKNFLFILILLLFFRLYGILLILSAQPSAKVFLNLPLTTYQRFSTLLASHLRRRNALFVWETMRRERTWGGYHASISIMLSVLINGWKWVESRLDCIHAVCIDKWLKVSWIKTIQVCIGKWLKVSWIKTIQHSCDLYW